MEDWQVLVDEATKVGKALVPLTDKGDAILGDFLLALQSDRTRHLDSLRKLPVNVRALVAPCKEERHRHLPYGLAIRLRQIVSVDEKFIKRLEELKSFLLARGYQSICGHLRRQQRLVVCLWTVRASACNTLKSCMLFRPVFSVVLKNLSVLGVVRNFRNFFKSVFPTKRGEGVLAKYELEKV